MHERLVLGRVAITVGKILVQLVLLLLVLLLLLLVLLLLLLLHLHQDLDRWRWVGGGIRVPEPCFRVL